MVVFLEVRIEREHPYTKRVMSKIGVRMDNNFIYIISPRISRFESAREGYLIVVLDAKRL